LRPPDPAESRIAELDGLRGLAIAAVLWHHLVAPYLIPGRESWQGWLVGATNLAWSGVDLFFVLSGFFIGGILLDHRDSPRLCRTFYLRRAVRILPLYYLTLGCLFLAVVFGLPHADNSFPWWSYAAFLTNFLQAGSGHWDWLPLSVLWSLAVEEQFYLAAPWIVRWLKLSWLPGFLAGLVGGALLLRLAMLWLLPEAHLARHVLMPMRMDALAAGALVAWLIRQQAAGPALAHLRRHGQSWLTVAALPAAGLTLLWPREGGAVLAGGGYTLLAAGFALVVLISVAGQPRWLGRVLRLAPLVRLGRHSYFLYLWHGLLGAGLIRWLGGPDFLLDSPPNLLVPAVALGATWLAAVVSWRWFETPFLRWGRRHAY
jgi:peptidoglycan/LPS O-acetylase OafA/YrhL